ncbi:hypothetical protein CORC01_07603 [Colletotrichum orchidophilum]|uniref:Uncharacterized protein n=1 Tax=Colletotrichum orchidophilum TaxID=1209926 RepID=A0A1G4B7A2_9PEZI|nr:uncharacterized protein CORC01_07603 [Colletotrichum orchidophilum]OHE97162.1 hypothetical protein CORC01_07603 [Colletotrichum orchidophilum]
MGHSMRPRARTCRKWAPDPQRFPKRHRPCWVPCQDRGATSSDCKEFPSRRRGV